MSDSQQLLGTSTPARAVSASAVQTLSRLSGAADLHHVASLSEHIGALFLDDNFSDVLLKIDDAHFHAHKVILAARSEYFRALLFGGMRETNQDTVELLDVNVGAFKVLLRYIYTGKITLSSLKEDMVLEVLGLAHKFGFGELEAGISEYLKSLLCPRNMCMVLDASQLFSLISLRSFCMDFADRHAAEIMASEGFLHLSPTTVEMLISRDSFCAPEIDIFRAVREWARHNPDADVSRILAQIRLPLMKLNDLLHSVRSSSLIGADAILDAIKEQTEKRDMDLRYRGILIPEINMATPERGAEVIEGELKQSLLNGDTQGYDMERGFTRHPIEPGAEGIVIQLGTQCIVNCIRMLLWSRDVRSYSYYVEVSMDRTDWVRVIDHTQYLCRAWQKLLFHPKVVKFIRVVGTHNTVNRVFHLVSMEAFYTTQPFHADPDNGLLIPEENVATIQGSASVIEGVSRSRNALLNGDLTHYDWDSGYTCHQLGSGAIVVQLPQPCIVGSIKLLLWDCDDRTYSYYIEVSRDQSNWKLVADKRSAPCRGLQLLAFDPTPVVFVRIVGTYNSANEVFHCVHFECPAQPPLPVPDK